MIQPLICRLSTATSLRCSRHRSREDLPRCCPVSCARTRPRCDRAQQKHKRGRLQGNRISRAQPPKRWSLGVRAQADSAARREEEMHRDTRRERSAKLGNPLCRVTILSNSGHDDSDFQPLWNGRACRNLVHAGSPVLRWFERIGSDAGSQSDSSAETASQCFFKPVVRNGAESETGERPSRLSGSRTSEQDGLRAA